MSYNNFVGCLKYAFFNDISILFELKKGNPKVHYIGVLEPELYETNVDVIPITLPFPSSYIWWPNRQSGNFTLKFAFKSSRSMAVLASSSVKTATGNGYWEVSIFTLLLANCQSRVRILAFVHYFFFLEIDTEALSFSRTCRDYCEKSYHWRKLDMQADAEFQDDLQCSHLQNI
jgi:hypothetical protein